MKTRHKLAAALMIALGAAGAASAQVPNTLYMQGLFLSTNGTPNPGVHSNQVLIFSNTTVVLSQVTSATANADGLANFTLSSTNLPAIFQTCTNTWFAMSLGPTQAFVATPYAFQAGNLPLASGNFHVWGDLTVASNAAIAALTAENGALLRAPVTIAKFAYFTNLAGAEFDGSLTNYGGLIMDGVVSANYATVFSSGTATSLFLAATNNICLSNAVIRKSFTCITTNMVKVDPSGMAAEDGFLIVWLSVNGPHTTAGVYVNIDGLTFTLQRYADAAQLGQHLYMFTGSTFPVAQGKNWSATLVNAEDKNNITIQCYWIPLHGDS